MASVQTVPLEILSTIFRFTVDQPSTQLHTAQMLTQYRNRICTLVKLSLVCRKWRSTALCDGTLWATLPVHTSRADCQESTTTVLERSKHAMLDVSIVCDDVFDSPCEDILLKISKNFDRIRSLHFATTSPGTLRSLSVPATKLEVLEIFSAEQPTELGFLFGGNLPALRSLVLAGLPSWPLGLFANLKDLCLILPPSHPTVKVSSLIDVMSGSPNIEQIKMSAFLSMVDDSPPSALVRLPHLQKFMMHDCDSAMVLSHTIIPASADIKVVIDHRRMRETMHISSRDCHILSSVPEDMSAMESLRESTMLVLRQDQRVGFGIGFYRSRSPQPSLRILDRSASIGLFARRSIEVLASRSHHFRNIKDLSIALSVGTTVPWLRLLRGFGRLERLSVVAFHASPILSALTFAGQENRPICPALRRLDIYEKGDSHAFAFDREVMVEFFMARVVLRCAVAEVTIHRPGKRKTWKCRAFGGREVVRY